MNNTRKPTAETTVVNAREATEGVDQARRRTLKMAAASAATAGTVVAASASAAVTQFVTHSSSPIDALSTTQTADESLGQFTVQVHHSWMKNDIAVVISNRGAQSHAISGITPKRLELARGYIDFGQLLDDGDLVLGPGESVEVPLTHHKGAEAILAASSASSSRGGYGHFDRSIQNMLKKRVTITTEGQAFAAVTVVPGPMLV